MSAMLASTTEKGGAATESAGARGRGGFCAASSGGEATRSAALKVSAKGKGRLGFMALRNGMGAGPDAMTRLHRGSRAISYLGRARAASETRFLSKVLLVELWLRVPHHGLQGTRAHS